MPRESSERSKASQHFKFQQSLIDVLNSSIEARVIHEKDLETDHLEWLLGPDPNSPRSVGISPAYSQSGSLPALACALNARILVINFHSSKAYGDGDVNGSSTRPRNVKRREMLEEKNVMPPSSLHSTHSTFAQLALSLRLHTDFRLTEAIDIQSALCIPDRSTMDSVTAVLSSIITIFSDNIRDTFDKHALQVQQGYIDLSNLVQRAWLSGWIGQCDYEGVKDLFYKSPKIL